MIELVSGNPVQAFVQQVVSGLASGAVYASLALSLVLIYRAMDVANFAQGEMAMFSTFIAYALITGFHLPYLIAFALTIAISFGGGVLIERVVIRPFEGSSVLTLVIVTLALFSIVNGTAGLIWGYVFKTFDSPFQFGAVHFQGLYIGYQDLGIIGVTLVVRSDWPWRVSSSWRSCSSSFGTRSSAWPCGRPRSIRKPAGCSASGPAGCSPSAGESRRRSARCRE